MTIAADTIGGHTGAQIDLTRFEHRDPPQLVEHFFRHESAKLVAVLTRAFGVRFLDLVEDKVQEALVAAMESWPKGGIPANPGGWIYRVARNRILDALRRDTLHQRVVGDLAPETPTIEQADDWWSEAIPDSLLRMMFVCCHPALDRRSQLALTLKILCGFSLAEVARGLLISKEAAKKRVQRAKKTLAEQEIELELPPTRELQSRVATVHRVLYLMFNEGYSTSQGHEPLRDDVCEEAVRLCHLLAEHTLGTSETRALLALMLAHAARLAARVDGEGATVLLADQDRSRWDLRLIHQASHWFDRSRTDSPSRYHYEAGIALTHCRATTLAETDWGFIVQLYDRLLALDDSPLYTLNRAIARGEHGDVATALADLESIRHHPELRDYPLLDCAVGRLHELAGNDEEALRAYATARSATRVPHELAVLDRKLEGLLKPDQKQMH